jgi:molybdenum cofactor cytidylyltransferase
MTSASGYSPLTEAVPSLAAIILAAGYSSRMGQFKPLLSVGDRTAVQRVIQSFVSAEILDVYVVLGHRAAELWPVVEAAGGKCVVNAKYAEGMYSSVCAGVAALPTCTKACFVIPADMPLVRVSTIRRLARSYAVTKNEIIYPFFQGHRGHPPLISHRVLAEAMEGGPEARLSTLLAAHEDRACNLFVPDEGIHLDMDTPDELVRIRELASHREIPSSQECEAILAVYQANEEVVRHSRIVAQVAHRIAVALTERSVQIEPLLAKAGGLLHDLAKGKPDHAAAGAKILRDLEFANVADVVAAHTDCSFPEQKLDESAIVYLADKLVKGEKVVGIEQRFYHALERFRENPIALAAALRRRATAEAISHEIESCLGVEIPQVISHIVNE